MNLESVGKNAIDLVKKHPAIAAGMVAAVAGGAYLMSQTGSAADTTYTQDTSALAADDTTATDDAGSGSTDNYITDDQLAELFAALEADTDVKLSGYTQDNQEALAGFAEYVTTQLGSYAEQAAYINQQNALPTTTAIEQQTQKTAQVDQAYVETLANTILNTKGISLNPESSFSVSDLEAMAGTAKAQQAALSSGARMTSDTSAAIKSNNVMITYGADGKITFGNNPNAGKTSQQVIQETAAAKAAASRDSGGSSGSSGSSSGKSSGSSAPSQGASMLTHNADGSYSNQTYSASQLASIRT